MSVHFRCGLDQRQTGNGDRATAALKAGALEDLPAAGCYYALNEVDQAQQFFEAALKHYPDVEEAQGWRQP
jgi:tetratricopeptide (TPR) repeat protein